MWRWSFFGVRKLHGDFKLRFAFQQQRNSRWSWSKKLKKALNWLSLMSDSRWWYLFHQNVKVCDSTTLVRIWQFQTPAWKRYLRMHFFVQLLVSWGWWLWFSEVGSQDLSNGTNVANFVSVFTSTAYDLKEEIVSRSYIQIKQYLEGVPLIWKIWADYWRIQRLCCRQRVRVFSSSWWLKLF